jgi:hypothetical protein
MLGCSHNLTKLKIVNDFCYEYVPIPKTQECLAALKQSPLIVRLHIANNENKFIDKGCLIQSKIK